jgi:indolepyruvate ferredoxin oxidoreductase
MNLLAFRWGRMAVVDRKQVEAAVAQATAQTTEESPQLDAEARALVERAGASGALRRRLEIRVPELIAYQNAAYAREYVDFVRRVAEVEAERAPGSGGLAEAVARNLYKLMAYKDEYEVARLHLDAAVQAQLAAKFGPQIRTYWHLHPPLLRALGLKKKVRLGAWFAPAFRLLRSLRGLRGTAFDPFGYAEVRRVERALIGEYRQLVETALVRLSPVTHAAVMALAELPDEIRGYEDIKLANVARFREKATQLIAQLN